jgi:hypothetical protein
LKDVKINFINHKASERDKKLEKIKALLRMKEILDKNGIKNQPFTKEE